MVLHVSLSAAGPGKKWFWVIMVVGLNTLYFQIAIRVRLAFYLWRMDAPGDFTQ